MQAFAFCSGIRANDSGQFVRGSVFANAALSW